MSRSDARSTRLRRRPSRIVPASLVALVLLAAGVLAVVAASFRLAQGQWPSSVTAAAPSVAGITWGSAAAVTVAVVVLLIGLVLLLAAVLPGSYQASPLRAAGPGAAQETEFVVSHRGLARLAASAADAVDGVDRVSTSASGQQVSVRVSTTSREQAELIRDRVRSAVTDRLSTAGLQPAPRVNVSVATKEI